MMVESLVDQLKRHEGFRAKPYRCPAGVLTIGYGFTELSRQEADIILDLKIKKLRWHFDSRGLLDGLTPARRDVILNMAYNLGIPRLMGFKRMWAAINAGDWDKAADEMLDSKWASQVRNRATELAGIMREG